MKKLEINDAELIDVTSTIKKFWYVDLKTTEAKKLEDYEGKLHKYDPKTFTVLDKAGKRITLYKTCKLATKAALYKLLEKKKDEWTIHTNRSLALNDEISALLEKIDNLNSDPSNGFY